MKNTLALLLFAISLVGCSRQKPKPEIGATRSEYHIECAPNNPLCVPAGWVWGAKPDWETAAPYRVEKPKAKPRKKPLTVSGINDQEFDRHAAVADEWQDRFNKTTVPPKAYFISKGKAVTCNWDEMWCHDTILPESICLGYGGYLDCSQPVWDGDRESCLIDTWHIERWKLAPAFTIDRGLPIVDGYRPLTGYELSKQQHPDKCVKSVVPPDEGGDPPGEVHDATPKDYKGKISGSEYTAPIGFKEGHLCTVGADEGCEPLFFNPQPIQPHPSNYHDIVITNPGQNCTWVITGDMGTVDCKEKMLK